MLESRHLSMDPIQVALDAVSAEFIQIAEHAGFGKTGSADIVAEAAGFMETYLTSLSNEINTDILQNCFELKLFLEGNASWAESIPCLNSRIKSFMEKIESYLSVASAEDRQKAYFQMSNSVYNTGNLEKALSFLEAADNQLPKDTNPNIQYNKATILMMMGEYGPAMRIYVPAGKKLREETKESSKLLNNQGINYKKMGFPKEARYFFEHAVKADPSNYEANLNLALDCCESGEAEKALPYFEKAYELRQSAFLSNHLARAYFAAGNFDKAAEHAIKFAEDLKERLAEEDS